MAESYKASAFDDGHRFKVQIEDAGTSPGGLWSYASSADGDGNQADFDGDGYYVYGTPGGELNRHGVQSDEVLTYRIEVAEGQTGTYMMRFNVSRDGEAESDKENDLWLNFYQEGSVHSIEDYLAASGSEPEPTSSEFIKVFGGPNDGTWGDATRYDGAPNNPAIELEINQPGIYVVEVAGRSEGYHVDAFQLYSSSSRPGWDEADSALAEDSLAAETGDTDPEYNAQTDEDDGGFFSFFTDLFDMLLSIFGGGKDDDTQTNVETADVQTSRSAISDVVPVVSILDHDVPITADNEAEEDTFDLLVS